MTDTLNLVPVGFAPADTYLFHNQQVIEFEAELLSTTVHDQEWICFHAVGWDDRYAQSNLQVYDNDRCIEGTDPYTVWVPLNRLDTGRGIARLRVIALIVPNGNYQVRAYRHTDPSLTSADLSFEVVESTMRVPQLRSGFSLPLPRTDSTPALSPGQYVRYALDVIGPDGAGLPNVRVKLRTLKHDNLITSISLFPAWDSTSALAVKKSPRYQELYAEVLTNVDGLAQVFLCGKKQMPAIGELEAVVGDAIVMGQFVITDFSNIDSVLPAPEVDEPDPVHLQDETPDIGGYVRYASGFANREILYVYCNRRYVGYAEVQGVGTAAGTATAQTKALPIARFDIPTSALYSQDYSARQNTLQYVTSLAAMYTVSPARKFTARGAPPETHPLSDHTGTPLAAPILAGNEDGWPVNIPMLLAGVTLRIPLAGSPILPDQVIDIAVYLNGHRVAPNDTEPLGALLRGPSVFAVTHRMVALGHADWLLPAQELVGFGQYGNAKALQTPAERLGDVGTLEAIYRIYADAGKRTAPLYTSTALRVGLDTIAPDGWYAPFPEPAY